MPNLKPVARKPGDYAAIENAARRQMDLKERETGRLQWAAWLLIALASLWACIPWGLFSADLAQYFFWPIIVIVAVLGLAMVFKGAVLRGIFYMLLAMMVLPVWFYMGAPFIAVMVAGKVAEMRAQAR